MHSKKHKIAAIILAGGTGSRMQKVVDDKILAPLRGGSVITRSINTFSECDFVTDLTVVYRDELQREQLEEAFALAECPSDKKVRWVQGGAERQDSVLNALRVQPEDSDFVLIHDGARPLITSSSLNDLHQTLLSDGSAVLAHRVTDTIKRTPDKDETNGIILEDLQRNRLWAMETPQAFDFKTILEAYETVARENQKITDDVAAAHYVGMPVSIVENRSHNPKITTPSDLAYIEWLLEQSERL